MHKILDGWVIGAKSLILSVLINNFGGIWSEFSKLSEQEQDDFQL